MCTCATFSVSRLPADVMHDLLWPRDELLMSPASSSGVDSASTAPQRVSPDPQSRQDNAASMALAAHMETMMQLDACSGLPPQGLSPQAYAQQQPPPPVSCSDAAGGCRSADPAQTQRTPSPYGAGSLHASAALPQALPGSAGMLAAGMPMPSLPLQDFYMDGMTPVAPPPRVSSVDNSLQSVGSVLAPQPPFGPAAAACWQPGGAMGLGPPAAFCAGTSFGMPFEATGPAGLRQAGAMPQHMQQHAAGAGFSAQPKLPPQMRDALLTEDVLGIFGSSPTQNGLHMDNSLPALGTLGSAGTGLGAPLLSAPASRMIPCSLDGSGGMPMPQAGGLMRSGSGGVPMPMMGTMHFSAPASQGQTLASVPEDNHLLNAAWPSDTGARLAAQAAGWRLACLSLAGEVQLTAVVGQCLRILSANGYTSRSTHWLP